MRKIRNITAIILCFVVIVSGCSSNNKSVQCKYSSATSGNLGDEAEFNNDDILSIINQNYVVLKNQSIDVADFNIALTDFFYHCNTGFVVYKLVISNTNNSILTEKQQALFKKLLDNGEIEFLVTELGNKICSQKLMTDSNGNTTLITSLLLSGIDSKDKINHISKKNIKQIVVTYENKQVSTFSLPGYTLETKEVWMNTSEEEKIISVQVSNLGIVIIWNTKSIIKEFKEELKEIKKQKGKDFNEEEYGYTVFKDLSLTLKDGTVYQISSEENPTNIFCDHREEYEKNQLYSYNCIFNAPIDIQNIDYVTIDGNNYCIATDK